MMQNEADGIRVSYSDFIRLCRVDDPENWMPGMCVAPDGVRVDAGVGSEQLTPHERSVLTEHPDGDPGLPLLNFPCTLGELRMRLWDVCGGGFIDPFDMADFVMRQARVAPTTMSRASEAQVERHAKTHVEVLSAALAVAWHFPSKNKKPSELARMVEEKAPLFWPDSGDVPLKSRSLTSLLSEAIKLPEK